MSVAVSIRFPEALQEALERLARSMDRPKTYLIRKAVETYLMEYADYQIALNRLQDKEDALISGSELRKRLAS